MILDEICEDENPFDGAPHPGEDGWPSDDVPRTADPVNHPPHYTRDFGGHEVIELTEWLDFNRGNAVKYLCRAGRKPGSDELEDLSMARWYIDREIQRVTRLRQPPTPPEEQR